MDAIPFGSSDTAPPYRIMSAIAGLACFVSKSLIQWLLQFRQTTFAVCRIPIVFQGSAKSTRLIFL
jgi:hypothetical protein